MGGCNQVTALWCKGPKAGCHGGGRGERARDGGCCWGEEGGGGVVGGVVGGVWHGAAGWYG
jgi:hypothetical protein